MSLAEISKMCDERCPMENLGDCSWSALYDWILFRLYHPGITMLDPVIDKLLSISLPIFRSTLLKLVAEQSQVEQCWFFSLYFLLSLSQTGLQRNGVLGLVHHRRSSRPIGYPHSQAGKGVVCTVSFIGSRRCNTCFHSVPHMLVHS